MSGDTRDDLLQCLAGAGPEDYQWWGVANVPPASAHGEFRMIVEVSDVPQQQIAVAAGMQSRPRHVHMHRPAVYFVRSGRQSHVAAGVPY